MTKRALLIAEKPSLMRAIQNAVNIHGFADDITYKTFVGHTMSLKMPEEYNDNWARPKTTIKDLPMIPAPFAYKPTPDKANLFKELKEEVLSGKYDYIINACDAGREGQHIFWSFFETVGSPLPVKRLWSSDTTPESLGKAINNLRDEKEPRLTNMKEASKLRAQLDWLIGMNASRAFSEKARANVAVGRVMTPALKLVVDRELEIQNFVPETFYEVEADFDSYVGKYKNDETKGRFDSKKAVEEFIQSLSDTGEVVSVNKRKQSTKAPELFSLQTLQSEAGKRFGYTMQDTLSIAQRLYDDGFISYPRTDSSYVTENTAATFPILLRTLENSRDLGSVATSLLSNMSHIDTIAKDKKYVDNKKVEDHDAILPTSAVPNRTFTKDEHNIYDLVARRFLAIFHPPYIVEKTTITTNIDKHPFITHGSILVQEGFQVLYKSNKKDQELPDVKKGETYKVVEVKPTEGKTTPPKRYTSSSLGDAMAAAGRFTDDEELKEILKESKGIGTPATRGGIVDKLVQRQMMSYKGKANTIHASDTGISIIQALGDHDVVSVELTADWEDKLRSIEKGELPSKQFEQEMKDYIQQVIKDTETMNMSGISSPKAKNGVGEVLGACPSCGKDVKVGNKVYFCEGYHPDEKQATCSFILGKKISGRNIPKTEAKKILDGKKTKELEFTSMKTKKKYKAKLFWNKDKNTLDREFPNTPKVQAQDDSLKTSDGHNITQDRFYWLAGDTGKKIGKEIWGHQVTQEQAKEMFDGKTIGPFKFTWRSGKSSNAKLSFDNSEKKVKYHFNY